MRNAYIFIGILFLTVGFAAISITLNIEGSSSLLTNVDDFGLYYSDAYVNGSQSLGIVKSDTVFEVNTVLWQVGETYTVEYEVTNGSENYDADVAVVCTGGNEYYTMENTFDSSTQLGAKQSRTGVLKFTLNRLYSGNENGVSFECVINGEAIERDEIGEGEVDKPVSEQYFPGKEVEIKSESGVEKFFYLSEDEDTVSLFAQHNLCSNFTQCEEGEDVPFSDVGGWEPGEVVDIQDYDGPVKTYINGYVDYLKEITGIEEITATLITLEEMQILGCQSTELGDPRNTCNESQHKDWLINGNSFWTRSTYGGEVDRIWRMYSDGFSNFDYYGSHYGVRPVITIPKVLLPFL